MTSTALALIAVLAGQAPAPSAAKPASTAKSAPMLVRVDAAPAGGSAVGDWAKQLSAALGARKDEFKLAAGKESPEFVVRLDSIAAGASGNQVVKGELAFGQSKRPFTYSFTDVHADSEKLARNLRQVADQMKATGK
jgi:hypothetical protein